MKSKFVQFYMNVAEETSKLSSAKRLQVGCVAVKDNRIIAYGYNGTPSGWDNGCEDHTNKTKPEVLHAEANCIAKIARSNESSEDCVMFITHSPCMDCAKLLYQSGVSKVYYKTQYRTCEGIDFLQKANIHIEHYNDNEVI